uniref:Uncharacterized protein n=1 Tax=Proboscia inermis TaxID=420281 RepID=A0A7S0GEM8_9STRA|mmetsp:Transcript_27631/g.28042  ORF Transcript_27631/g.28042 Transcript_27631/m.28042 type:complete len:113 (+) Transcript_27631:638-976(+)
MTRLKNGGTSTQKEYGKGGRGKSFGVFGSAAMLELYPHPATQKCSRWVQSVRGDPMGTGSLGSADHSWDCYHTDSHIGAWQTGHGDRILPMGERRRGGGPNESNPPSCNHIP